MSYNGWTNYATWRIALEIFDAFNIYDLTTSTDIHDIRHAIREYVEELLSIDTPNELAYSYAYAFIEQVNWYEIAEHLLEDMTTE